jgi:hypothetical protein
MKSLALIAAAFLFLFPGMGVAFQEVQNHASWIKECQGDRLYINADKLEIKEDSISVRDANNIPHPLTNIFVDSAGIFTTTHSMSEDELAVVWNIFWCRTCNAYRSTDMRGLCVVCGNRP